MRNPGGSQSFGDKVRRSVFSPAKLRISVKVAANSYKLRSESRNATIHLLKQRWRLRRFASGHGGKESKVRYPEKINFDASCGQGYLLL